MRTPALPHPNPLQPKDGTTMGLDISFHCTHCKMEIEAIHLTHNLAPMAREVGVYVALWQADPTRPASQFIETLNRQQPLARRDEAKLRALEPEGWGTYEGLLSAIARILEVARENPDARVEVSV